MRLSLGSFCAAVETSADPPEGPSKGASFDVDGICTPVCILKGFEANSFNVCLLALTLLHGQIHLCTPDRSVSLLSPFDFWLLPKTKII